MVQAPTPPPPQAALAGPGAAAARPSHARTLWSSRLGSGLRAALACAVIGFTAVYGPPALRRGVAFSAFSYVSAVLIAGEATLGEGLHGVACAAYASVPGALLGAGVMSLGVGPGGLSVAARTLAVVLCSFVVALLEFLPLLAKRLALGQIVLIYVAPLALHGERSAVWQPVHVAASAALGVAASLLALLLPYPRLACREVSKKSRLFADVASERLGLLLNAFCADNSAFAVASISRVKWLSETGDKLLRSIKMKQAAMERENTCGKFSSPSVPLQAPAERLQAVDTLLRGMDLALSSVPSFPVKIVDGEELRDHLLEQENHIRRRTLLQNLDRSRAAAKETTPRVLPQRSNTQLGDHFLVARPPSGSEDLPPLFFLFCMKLLGDLQPTPEHLSDNRVAPARSASAGSPTEQQEEQPAGTTTSKTRMIGNIMPTPATLMAALKCSLSLGLAVYLGLLFSKDNGYWSGLAVAVVMAPGREATFRLANARAQGTALGTVYGVLGALISRDLMWLRILVLLPWIVLTSFLRRSRMYGHAGGICAALAAIMVLGRRYGAASDAFAVTRLTETCIGLSCSILVELLLQPTRASSLARRQLSQSITELRDRVNSAPELSVLLDHPTERAMRGRIDQLEKTIGEADGEPNFWFLPFPAAHYSKLQSSLHKMVELVVFMGRGLELLNRMPGLDWNEVGQELIREDMDAFKKVVGSSLQHCLEDVDRSDKKVVTKDGFIEKVGALGQTRCSDDLETGKAPPKPCPYCTVVRADHEEDPEKILASFLHHAEDVVERFVGPGGVKADHGDGDGDHELGGACRRSQDVVLCMAAVGFCMRGLMREAQEVRKAAVELAQRENPPTRQVGHDLFEISSKLRKSLNI